MTSRFTLAVPKPSTSKAVFVAFAPISQWTFDNDKVIFYSFNDDQGSVNPHLRSTLDREWDWIGLFHEDFTGLDEFISYVWINEPEVRPDVVFDEGDGVLAGTHFPIRYPVPLMPGRYRLLYFNGEFATSCLGMSSVFEVTY